jgi:hypothetical protein
MRNSVVRKKRIRAQRLLDDFMRFPMRLVTPYEPTITEWASPNAGRLWAPR